jgi:hypothetical protein
VIACAFKKMSEDDNAQWKVDQKMLVYPGGSRIAIHIYPKDELYYTDGFFKNFNEAPQSFNIERESFIMNPWDSIQFPRNFIDKRNFTLPMTGAVYEKYWDHLNYARLTLNMSRIKYPKHRNYENNLTSCTLQKRIQSAAFMK